eukprot:jgi/Chlat1/5397/Chrsp35S05301
MAEGVPAAKEEVEVKAEEVKAEAEAEVEVEEECDLADAPSVPAADATDEPDYEIREINKDNFHEMVRSAGTKLVVVDFFTDWCGPCKLMYPKLVELSKDYAGRVTFFKFNCNQYNKPIAKELEIKVVPTFHVYKRGERIQVVGGAKLDKIIEAIDESLTPA